MATMRFQVPSQASGLGWSLTSYPFPAAEEDDRPKAVATEKLFRRHAWAESWQLAYNTGDEYPAGEEGLFTEAQINAPTAGPPKAEPVSVTQQKTPERPGRICPEPGCGATLPERGFGPHLAKHRRAKAAQ